jgi:diguanylate cyclase (GGDEF)-like protein/PAS domain S-box-containing protein
MSRKARSSCETPQSDFCEDIDADSEVDRVLSVDGHLEASSSDADRLRCMIELSSDYYWELDAQFRVTQIWYGSEDDRQRAASLLIGKTRWDIGGVPVDGTWEEHKATLRAHEPFDDFIVEWGDSDGATRFLKFSGRPRFSERGRFLGYMGVTQDISQVFLRDKLARLEASFASILANGRGAGTLVEAMDFVCAQLDWTSGHLWAVDEAIGIARLVESTGGCDEVTSGAVESRTKQCVRRVEGEWQEACRAQEIRWLPGPDASDSGNDRVQPLRIVLVPVIEAAGVAALLEIVAPTFKQLPRDLESFLSHLAIQLHAARERAVVLERLKESEQRFVSTVELAAIGICHVGLEGNIIHANQLMCETLGYTKEELLSKTVWEISHPDDRRVSEDHLKKLLAKEIESFKIEKRYLRKNGESVWVRINTVIQWGGQGEPLHHISVVEDISEQKAAEDRIEHLATHDALTEIPNRALFSELLANAVHNVERNPDRPCAVLFIDLDRFKAINDSLGHQSGDALLKAAARRIQENLRNADCVARFGGDEFVALLTGLDKAATAETIARKVLLALQKPIMVRGHACRVTASVGVAVCPEDGDEAHLLMRNADIAMYAAKQSGRNDVQRYSTDMTTMSVKQITLATHLHLGLEREEFRIQYQPRVDAQSGKIVGAEALLRWWNSELGTIPPVQFLPVAEETDLIIPIGKWVIRAACEQVVSWQEKGLSPVFVSVNLSPKQFRDPDLVGIVQNCVEITELRPELLELEITEGAWMSDLEHSIAVGTALRSLGVRLAMDDFGTACASLDQLKLLPLDTIKIDRSYIRDVINSQEDRKTTEAIIAVGKALGVSVVAEGIERVEQFELLSQMECGQMQGFYFGKSCHPQEMSRLLRECRPFRPRS